jgi:hypothetical protein
VAAHGDGDTTAMIDEPSARKPTVNRARDAVAYLREDAVWGVPYVATGLTEAGFGSDDRLFPEDTDVCEHSNRPSWSPDGDRLAIICVDGPELDQRSLRVTTLDGELGPALVESPGLAGGPSWADDGTIYYADASADSGFDALWALPDDGNGDPTQLAECDGAWLANPDWGTPGVLFTCGDTKTGPGQLRLLRPDGSVVELGDTDAAWATWSPDYTAVAGLVDGTLATAPYSEDGGTPHLGAFEYFDVSGTIGEPAWGSR